MSKKFTSESEVLVHLYKSGGIVTLNDFHNPHLALQMVCDRLLLISKQDNALYLTNGGHSRAFDLLMTRNPSTEGACHAL